MRMVCVHYPTMGDPPDSLYWLGNDGRLRSAREGGHPSSRLAEATMFRKVPEVRWIAYFGQLAERTPDPENWDTFMLEDDANPREFLSMLRRAHKS